MPCSCKPLNNDPFPKKLGYDGHTANFFRATLMCTVIWRAAHQGKERFYQAIRVRVRTTLAQALRGPVGSEPQSDAGSRRV